MEGVGLEIYAFYDVLLTASFFTINEMEGRVHPMELILGHNKDSLSQSHAHAHAHITQPHPHTSSRMHTHTYTYLILQGKCIT